MSLSRCATPVSSAAYYFLRFASPQASAKPPACPFTIRQFTSSMSIRLSSKRKIQTATAYRPHTLDSVPPPPRNSGIPDTSIAGSIPQVNDIRAPGLGEQYQPPSLASVEEQPSFSITEGEAQKSQPTTNVSSSIIPESYPPKQKRTRLRPRKAAVSLTPTAITHLRDLLSLPEPKLIRIGVKNRGCSGLAYHLEYVEKPGAFDEAVEQDGVKVLIDSKALFSIIGSEMDWVEDKLNQRFVFRNPNISMYS